MNREVIHHCVCCKEAPSVLLAKSPFCSECFVNRLEKVFFAEVRKSLSHTFRKRERKVLVVLDDSTLASQILKNLTKKSTSATIKYHYCTFTKDENAPCNGYTYIASKENTHNSRVEAAKEYAFNNDFSCILFSHYSVEVAYEILKMITSGNVAQYIEAFKGDNTISVCYPFYAVSYKSIAFFALYTGILDSPAYIKISERKEKESQAHGVLIRDLLKNSPASILNLIRIQQRMEDA
ncbi:hypothetical protein NEAUS06_1294 [Nematocida ausubeli]|nr:hypothetical protein NEAUS06_1294 [Nematocida ausubeli]